mmetsp:Transcript_24066/g.64368  ORF Transcript_24066/g.64368 Transcript_24066/m.64368 type:complete len:200 (+) Transcript_24066:219-818(+)
MLLVRRELHARERIRGPWVGYPPHHSVHRRPPPCLLCRGARRGSGARIPKLGRVAGHADSRPARLAGRCASGGALVLSRAAGAFANVDAPGSCCADGEGGHVRAGRQRQELPKPCIRRPRDSKLRACTASPRPAQACGSSSEAAAVLPAGRSRRIAGIAPRNGAEGFVFSDELCGVLGGGLRPLQVGGALWAVLLRRCA